MLLDRLGSIAAAWRRVIEPPSLRDRVTDNASPGPDGEGYELINDEKALAQVRLARLTGRVGEFYCDRRLRIDLHALVRWQGRADTKAKYLYMTVERAELGDLERLNLMSGRDTEKWLGTGEVGTNEVQPPMPVAPREVIEHGEWMVGWAVPSVIRLVEFNEAPVVVGERLSRYLLSVNCWAVP